MSDIRENENENEISEFRQRFKIVLCEIFNPFMHGIDNNSDPNILGHYLVHSKYDYILPPQLLAGYDRDGEYWDEEWFEENPDIYEVIPAFKYHFEFVVLNNVFNKHPLIRNYKAIISNENYIKPEIAECFYLSGDECVAILKTFWLRIVQRTWKRVFKERKTKIQMRMHPMSLHYREIHGNWPSKCAYLPTIEGMLSK